MSIVHGISAPQYRGILCCSPWDFIDWTIFWNCSTVMNSIQLIWVVKGEILICSKIWIWLCVVDPGLCEGLPVFCGTQKLLSKHCNTLTIIMVIIATISVTSDWDFKILNTRVIELNINYFNLSSPRERIFLECVGKL